MFYLWNTFELPGIQSGRVHAGRQREIQLQPGDTATVRMGIRVNAFQETHTE